MELREIARLDLQGARELLFACTTDLKRHEKDSAALEAERATWVSRVSLAESRGLADLVAGAKARVGEIEARMADIESSATEIRADIARIRDALPGIRAKERSIDPDRLLAELQMMTGEALGGGAPLDREFEALEKAQPGAGTSNGTAAPDDPLTALKKKMGLA